MPWLRLRPEAELPDSTQTNNFSLAWGETYASTYFIGINSFVNGCANYDGGVPPSMCQLKVI
jgi:hypothetical protein